MTSYVTPKKNSAFIFYIGLPSQANPNILQSNPTLAAGDFNVSTDGGALGPLGTTPTVTPASGKMVKITLASGEMNGDNVTVVCSDAAGAEWCDVLVNIQTSARQIDDLSTVTTAQVNAEVVDGLAVDTYAELVAVPAGTSTIANKLNWLFALARNKITQTATTQTLRNDADSGNIATSTDSDTVTTYTRGEWS